MIRSIYVILVVFFGTAGVGHGADFDKGIAALIRAITLALLSNGSLSPKKAMPMPSSMWVCCMNREKGFQ